jgi:hypothetical protein
MSAVFAKGGIEELRKFIDLEGKKAEEKKKFRGKLVMRKKNEGVQNKEKKS